MEPLLEKPQVQNLEEKQFSVSAGKPRQFGTLEALSWGNRTSSYSPLECGPLDGPVWVKREETVLDMTPWFTESPPDGIDPDWKEVGGADVCTLCCYYCCKEQEPGHAVEDMPPLSLAMRITCEGKK